MQWLKRCGRERVERERGKGGRRGKGRGERGRERGKGRGERDRGEKCTFHSCDEKEEYRLRESKQPQVLHKEPCYWKTTSPLHSPILLPHFPPPLPLLPLLLLPLPPLPSPFPRLHQRTPGCLRTQLSGSCWRQVAGSVEGAA